ncbi:hypothetical protein [Oceanotoga phage vB_OteS-UFV02]
MTIVDGKMILADIYPNIIVDKGIIKFGGYSSYMYIVPDRIEKIAIERGYNKALKENVVYLHVHYKYEKSIIIFSIYAKKEELLVVDEFIEELKKHVKVEKEEYRAVKI